MTVIKFNECLCLSFHSFCLLLSEKRKRSKQNEAPLSKLKLEFKT